MIIIMRMRIMLSFCSNSIIDVSWHRFPLIDHRHRRETWAVRGHVCLSQSVPSEAEKLPLFVVVEKPCPTADQTNKIPIFQNHFLPQEWKWERKLLLCMIEGWAMVPQTLEIDYGTYIAGLLLKSEIEYLKVSLLLIILKWSCSRLRSQVLL